jgi:hypothetical protein
MEREREREATVACPESIFSAKWGTAGLKEAPT